MNSKGKIICAALIVLALLAAAFIPLSQALGQQGVDTGTMNRSNAGSYMGIGDSERYYISFRQASLREALQFLAWISEININIPEKTEGTVNVSFRDVTIDDAINSIIKSNQLEYTIEGKVIRIGKSEQFKESGEDLKTETFRLHYAPSKEMESKIKTLLSSRGSVISDERTNSIVVRELPANIDNVRKFIDSVDIKDAQVLIESKIMEATRSFGRALGIQWGVTKGGSTSPFSMAGIKAVGQDDYSRNLNVNLSPSTIAATSGILIGAMFKGVNLDAQILAAEQRGDVYVLSDPSIVTSNGRSANIRSGATLLVQGSSQVNIGTTSGTAASTGSGLQQIETGIELKVTPQITTNDFVKLDIETTSSTPDFSRAVQGIPIIVDNTAKTTVLVKDGETTVIGGLSRFSDALAKKRVPYLANVPIFGNLFKSRERSKENSELMVFIKPTIIRVEGIAPAQVRVREMEERKADMYLEPILNPPDEVVKDSQRKGASAVKRGNKYVK